MWNADAKGCASGPVKLNPPSGDRRQLDVVGARAVHANLDGDPALESAVILVRVIGDPSPEQAVAYDRDAAGRVVSLGRDRVRPGPLAADYV